MGVRIGSWPPRDAVGYSLVATGAAAFLALSVFTGVQVGVVEADKRAAVTAETVHELIETSHETSPLIGYDTFRSDSEVNRVTLRSADTYVTVDRRRTRVTSTESAWCVSVESHSGRIFQVTSSAQGALPAPHHCR